MGKIKQHTGLILIALLLLVAAFYWYEWRPSQIKKECHEGALVDVVAVGGSKEDYESFYKACLRSKGL